MITKEIEDTNEQTKEETKDEDLTVDFSSSKIKEHAQFAGFERQVQTL